ncbi:MAG: hypothetical protein ACKV22_10000 [Bryobacteraceae bacterium]
MTTRKRHSKPQFVIPEEVEKQDTSGWTYRTEEKPPVAAAVKPVEAPAAKAPAKSSSSLFDGPIKSGMRAVSYGIMAGGVMLLFSFQVAILPMTAVSKLIRR